LPLEINLTEESQTDFEEAFFWYADVSENLSIRFSDEFYFSLEKISKQPLMYQKVIDEAVNL
jgi:predicted DNA binding CopG/RHH family protein